MSDRICSDFVIRTKEKKTEMATTCEIEFENNPSKVVFSGEIMRGTVHLTLTEEKNVFAVFLKITGCQYTRFSKGDGKNRRSYTGNEKCLDERINFVDNTNGECS